MLVWAGEGVGVFRFESGRLRQLYGSNSGLQGSEASVSVSGSQFLVNDPGRYLAVYACHTSITELGRYVPAFAIVSACFIGEQVLVSDERGRLMVLSYSMEPYPFARFTWTKTVSLDFGEGVACFRRVGDSVLYVTEN